MCTLDLWTNEPPLKKVLRSMTAEVELQKEWQAKLRYRRLYLPQPLPAVTKNVRVRYRVAWERVLLALIAIACLATFKANSALEDQYRHDASTAYRAIDLR